VSKIVGAIPIEDLQNQFSEYFWKKYFLHSLNLYKKVLSWVIPSEELLAREDYAQVQESLLDISRMLETPLNQTNKSFMASEVGHHTNRSIIPQDLKENHKRFPSPIYSREKSPEEKPPKPMAAPLVSPINKNPMVMTSPPQGSFKKLTRTQTTPL
jgi:hypothetical protein